MAEQLRNSPEIASLLDQVRQAKNLPAEEAFALCQGIVPQETEDARILLAKLSELFPGFWTKTHGLLDPSTLIKEASELREKSQLIEEIRGIYYCGKNSERKVLFEEVYKVARRYLKEGLVRD